MDPDSRQSAYTRCDHCSAVLPVTFEQLGEAGGMVRCGSCGRTLNALARLETGDPGADSRAVHPNGMPPILQPRVEQEQILGSAGAEGEPADDDADPEPEAGPVLNFDLEPEPPPLWARVVWPLLALLLLAALGLQLFGPERWRVDLDWPGFGAEPLVPVADAIQLVSRDMHPHPSLDDAVIVSAVMINRAAQAVPWPDIEIRLFDASQQPVGRRRLEPSDYLDEGVSIDRGLAPDVRVPLVLEMTTGASRPVGFSMSFVY